MLLTLTVVALRTSLTNHAHTRCTPYTANRLEWQPAKAKREWADAENLRLLRCLVEESGQNVNVPQAGYAHMPGTQPLGQLLANVRSGHTPPSNELLVFLNEKGFEWHPAKAKREQVNSDNLCLLRCLVEEYGKNVNVPNEGYTDLPWTLRLGRLLNNIRSDNTQRSMELLAFLNEKGFMYSFRNLARHVAQRHGVSFEDLRDATPVQLSDYFRVLQDALRLLPKERKKLCPGWCRLTLPAFRERLQQDLLHELRKRP